MVNLKLNLRCFTQNYTGAVDYLNPLTRFQFNYIILYYILYIYWWSQGEAISPLFFSSLSFKDSKLQNSNEDTEKEELENNTARAIIKEKKTIMKIFLKFIALVLEIIEDFYCIRKLFSDNYCVELLIIV